MVLARHLIEMEPAVPLTFVDTVAHLPPDADAAWGALRLVCAACRSDQDVRLQDEVGEFAFCDGCLEAARTPVLDVELGGES